MRRAVLIIGGLLSVSACTRGGDVDTAGEQPTTTVAAPTTSGGDLDPAGEEPAPEPAATEPTAVEEGPTTTSAPPTIATVTTFPVVEVPETGVPGIDSADAFCAAWSRFGGSWQVIQVAANFAPDPSTVPFMEVSAAPVVVEAYDSMFANWPEELADERDVVADGFFGPLARRAEVAVDALRSAGADEVQLDAIAAAWVDALAVRDLEEPVLLPALGADLAGLVDAAAATFAAQRVDFVDDPTMRIVAETPRTDAYLATSCPDQGALTGGEIDAA
jgi:hypothetical protein